MILALDPSSTCTGYALLRSADDLAEAGRLRPGKTRDSAVHRITAMGVELAALIREWQPDEIVIEITSGKVGCRGRQRGMNGAGLAVYGMAVGYLWRVCLEQQDRFRPPVYTVAENDWTRGVPKQQRAAGVALKYRNYRVIDDPGGDVADAIGLGCWWLREAALRRVAARAAERRAG